MLVLTGFGTCDAKTIDDARTALYNFLSTPSTAFGMCVCVLVCALLLRLPVEPAQGADMAHGSHLRPNCSNTASLTA